MSEKELNLRELMEQKGASKAQLESQTLKMAEEAIAENENILPTTAVSVAKRLNQKLDHMDMQMTALRTKMDVEQHRMEKIKAEIDKTRDDVSKYVDAESEKFIQDERLKDALLVYGRTLIIAKEVFGEEKMTENVIMQAIESGSFALWRSIMGGKFNDENDSCKVKRVKRL